MTVRACEQPSLVIPQSLYRDEADKTGRLGKYGLAFLLTPSVNWKMRQVKMQFDFYTLIFAGLAVFVIFKLRSVLGTRTGEEKPPFDPFQPREPVKPANESKTSNEGLNDNVIPLQRTGEVKTGVEEPATWRWEGIAAEGSPLADGFDTLVKADRSFDPRNFQSGARAAYEMIVTAFSRCDRKSLKDLLSKDVFDGFNGVMTAREQRGETAETTFVSIDKVDILQAGIKDGTMQVVVRFVSKIISATRDKNGLVVDGNPEKVADITDIWTFAREVAAKDPNWKLVATEAGH